jgi:hypothetical protein
VQAAPRFRTADGAQTLTNPSMLTLAAEPTSKGSKLAAGDE